MAIQADLRAASCRTDWLRTGAGYRQCCRRKPVVGYLNLLVLLCTEADADSGPHGRGLPDQAASEGLCRPMLEPAARVLAWLKRNLRTFKFIDDDPRAGGECCLTDGHGCWQSGDTLRPITMPLRNLAVAKATCCCATPIPADWRSMTSPTTSSPAPPSSAMSAWIGSSRASAISAALPAKPICCCATSIPAGSKSTTSITTNLPVPLSW